MRSPCCDSQELENFHGHEIRSSQMPVRYVGAKPVALRIRAHAVLAQKRRNVFICRISFVFTTVVPRAASRDQHAAVKV